jgi:hypothetical protein
MLERYSENRLRSSLPIPIIHCGFLEESYMEPYIIGVYESIQQEVESPTLYSLDISRVVK